MDLGIVNGTKIKYQMESAGKDPIAYEVRGATVALRKAQAEQIFISKEGITYG
jgi:Fe2+ transport system protein FeoA